MTVEQELELVQQAKTNIQAFGAIYDQYFGRIYIYCRRRLVSRELAEDVASQVFLAAIEGIDKFDIRHGVRFGSWLFRTANFKVLDTYRKHYKHLLVKLQQAIEHPDQEINLDQDLDLTHIQVQINIVMSQLNPRYQEVITLKYYAELEINEIAEIMDEKSTNVSVLLHRALEDFRKKFRKKYKTTEIFELF